MKIIAIIPARGGSKGIPRKNIRLMNGKPLISYPIECAQKSRYDLEVVVSTDDNEIKQIALQYGALVVERPKELAGDAITLDPVISHAVEFIENESGYTYDIVITMQPTSPLLTTKTLDLAIDYIIKNGLDTVISGVNDPRLSWRFEGEKYVPNYKERLNRQYMPKELKETGAFVISKREYVTSDGRFGKNVSLFELPESESGDIDTPQDWWIAEMEMNKKVILIRTAGYKEIGMGHIYRGLQIASSFIEHEVRFVLDEKSDIGLQKIKNSHYKYDVIKKDYDLFDIVRKYNADIVINDILNTSEDYIEKLKGTGVRVINFEDLGEGASKADATINALYKMPENGFDGNVYWGTDFYLIRDEFLLTNPREFSQQVKEILIVFGGTDPNHLTLKTLEAISDIKTYNRFHVTIILGMGCDDYEEMLEILKASDLNIDFLRDVSNMAEYMQKADLAISSQGRTMLELASLGVPTVLMAQNKREITHEFGGIKNGFLNLGLGVDTEKETIKQTIRWLIDCPQIRKNMHEEMLQTDLHNGMKRVKKIILGEE